MDFVILELSFIVTFIYELQNTFSSFCSILILSFVDLSIKPLFHAVSILFIIFPLSNIFGTIFMGIGSLTASLIVNPFSFINVTISMVKSSLTIGLIVFPLSNIFGSISPSLDTETLSFSIKPLTFIRYSIIKFYFLKFHNFFLIDSRFNKLIIFFSFSSTNQITMFLFFSRCLESLIILALIILLFLVFDLARMLRTFTLEFFWLFSILLELTSKQIILIIIFD